MKIQAFMTILSAHGRIRMETATMGQGSEPIYVLEISRMKYWLDVGIYASEDDSYESLTFVPADPETCPYENPYYVG